MQNTSCFTCLQSLWILLVTFHTFNKLNSQNGTLTNCWQRQSDRRIKACHRLTPRDTGSATRFEFDHSQTVCLPATDWKKKHSLTAAPVFSAHVLHLFPLFSILCCIFLPLSLSVCLSLCCISVPPSRSVFIPLFLCTHWPCSGVQCSYRRVWVGMLVTQWAPLFT